MRVRKVVIPTVNRLKKAPSENIHMVHRSYQSPEEGVHLDDGEYHLGAELLKVLALIKLERTAARTPYPKAAVERAFQMLNTNNIWRLS